MATIIQLRRDTAANWTANNPVLADGEPGLEKDTGKEKIGDGVTAWNSLSYKATGDNTKLDKTDNIQALWTGTQAEYDAITTPDANTLYFIQ